jgi:benzil reductase ((S)-benzoin forming)
LSNDTLTRVYAFSLGVMDTIMQHQIRGVSKSAFSNIDRFTDLQKMHLLPSAETVASKILQLLFSNENLRNGRYNIRDFEQ